MLRRMERLMGKAREEEGAIIVLAALMLVLVFAAAALAVDIASKSQDRTDLWVSSDAAALAGASLLPDDPAGAKAEALKFALANDPDLAGNIDATFRCVVGDRDGDGMPDPLDIPLSCNPGPESPPAPPTLTGFICADGVCAAPCDPDMGHKCNSIVLETEKTTDFSFAPVIGIDSGDTEIISAACRGICAGALTEPVDLIMVIDRTGSMSGAKILNALNAAQAVLEFFDPALQHVGVAFLPAADPTNLCASNADQTAGGRWLGVGLSNDYKDPPLIDYNFDGTLDLSATSPLVNVIRCSTAGGWTNLGSPINDNLLTGGAYGMPSALPELINNGRPGVKKGIIMLSDGEANRPQNRDDDCLFAANMAQEAKDAGVEIFTIGFGVVGLTCTFDTTPPPPLFYQNQPVSALLADMASNGATDQCASPAIENSDGDNFFCEPSGGDLSGVFLAAAAELAGGSQLIQLPPGA